MSAGSFSYTVCPAVDRVAGGVFESLGLGESLAGWPYLQLVPFLHFPVLKRLQSSLAGVGQSLDICPLTLQRAHFLVLFCSVVFLEAFGTDLIDVIFALVGGCLNTSYAARDKTSYSGNGIFGVGGFVEPVG